jgi:hypothetical protein
MSAAEPQQTSTVALAEQHSAIPNGLPDELVRTLATLNGAEPRAAQALIASLPFGSRATLSAYRLIEPIVDYSDAISLITITPDGWSVIRASAETNAPNEQDEAHWAAELDAAQARYRAGRFALVDSVATSLHSARVFVEERRRRRNDRAAL